MNQSTMLIGTLLAAFVLYLAANGRIGVYLGIMTGKATTGSSASVTPTILSIVPGGGGAGP